ncbi:FAD-dependent oxidoreductase [Sulfitobacter porphyrae]|uniref:FAD-dependent oxidoreductase n=1 Tax=Sulfitobacter porphyrae TaxID=1246864 RepID=A0ABW2B3Y3_9RHOB
MRFSGWRVLREGLTGNKGWTQHWRDPEPKPEYDAVIIGGGGHGLSTAYYLARNHGMTNIAVLEKGYLGGGNVGRNTTIVRANYFLQGNSEFYSHSLKLWEGMEKDLNYNAMHSQRGLINLFHSDGQRDAFARRGNAMINQGDDAVLLDREGCAGICPISTSTMAASRSTAGCCIRAAAPRGMMRWPGAMRAAPTSAVWT